MQELQNHHNNNIIVLEKADITVQYYTLYQPEGLDRLARHPDKCPGQWVV